MRRINDKSTQINGAIHSIKSLDSERKSNNVRRSSVHNSLRVCSLLGKPSCKAVAIVPLLFGLLFFHHHEEASRKEWGSVVNDAAAPAESEAYLTPDEYQDIRMAREGESVLVTGGLGFIGSHVVDLLLHQNFKVTILDNESNGHNHNRYAKEMIPNDITVVNEFPRIPGDEHEHYTHVIHLAAAISVAESMENPNKYERINYGGSERVLEWITHYNRHISSDEYNGSAPPIRRVVAASSAAIYGDPDPELLPLQESAPYAGLSPYADTKFRMEGLMQDFVDVQNNSSAAQTSATALRFFNVYGPRQDPKNPYSGVISLFFEFARKGEDITILGDGGMTRDFVYVKDVARAIVLALVQEREKNNDVKFAVYNVCTGKSITINALAQQVKVSMNSKSRIKHMDPRGGDIRESSCNSSRAMDRIGFVAAVSLEAGLEKTASWFKHA